MDLGTGDGRFVLDLARANPGAFHIGIDPLAEAMADVSRRAAAKPARGGVGNAMFVQASLEGLPGALAGLADAITVNYPWGSLLRAVALPDAVLLANLAGTAKRGATLDVLINMQPLRDTAYAARLGLAEAALTRDIGSLKATYAGAGWRVTGVDDVTGTLVRATRWGSQLHHAKREVWRLRAVRARWRGG
jgi:16S rRNA (adenine(1408)-N(1))-methyltransferase